jgi:hypothetical protein
MMRTYLTSLVLALLSLTVFAEDKEITISSGNAPVLKLTVPQEAKVTTKGEKTSIEAKNLWIYLWQIKSAKSVSEVIPHVGEVIKSEFTDFAVGETKTISVAGREAKHLMGKGAEADDGDPGTADVVIFTDGKNVFAACVHGEKTEAARERPDLLKVLKSAKAP